MSSKPNIQIKSSGDTFSAQELNTIVDFFENKPDSDELIPGPEGPQGIQGIQGPEGPKGDDGKSTYEIAVDNGFVGTEQEWLESLSPVRYMDGDIFEGDGETPETKTTIKDGSIEGVKLSEGTLPFINVLQNGVSQNGTDQSVKIQSLIGSNKTLYFPRGIYSFTDFVSIQNVSNLKIKGEFGTVFTTTLNKIFAIEGNVENLEISGNKFISTKIDSTNDPEGLIFIANYGDSDVMSNIKIEHNEFTNPGTKSNAIKVISEGSESIIQHLSILHNKFISIGRFGIETQNHIHDGVVRVKNYEISHNYFYDVGTIQSDVAIGCISVSGADRDGKINFNEIVDMRMTPDTDNVYYGIENNGHSFIQTIGNMFKSTSYGFTGIVGTETPKTNWLISQNIFDLQGTDAEKFKIIAIDLSNTTQYEVSGNTGYTEGYSGRFDNCSFGKIYSNNFKNKNLNTFYFHNGCTKNEIYFNTLNRTGASDENDPVQFNGASTTNNYMLFNNLIKHDGTAGSIVESTGATNNSRSIPQGQPLRLKSNIAWGDALVVSGNAGQGEIRFGGNNGRSIGAYSSSTGSLDNLDINATGVYFFGRAQATELEVSNASNGLILKSPNGTRYRVKVGDDGILTATAI